MKNKKKATIVFHGFGFPIKLINVPMKKVFGEWYLDINMNLLQTFVLYRLVYKPTSLAGEELRFIRKHLRMTTTEFGKLFGISHVAVLKWEKKHNHAAPPMEFYIRMHVLDYLKAKSTEFEALYKSVPLTQLSKSRTEKIHPIKVDVSDDELKSRAIGFVKSLSAARRNFQQTDLKCALAKENQNRSRL